MADVPESERFRQFQAPNLGPKLSSLTAPWIRSIQATSGVPTRYYDRSGPRHWKVWKAWRSTRRPVGSRIGQKH